MLFLHDIVQSEKNEINVMLKIFPDLWPSMESRYGPLKNKLRTPVLEITFKTQNTSAQFFFIFLSFYYPEMSTGCLKSQPISVPY